MSTVSYLPALFLGLLHWAAIGAVFFVAGFLYSRWSRDDA